MSLVSRIKRKSSGALLSEPSYPILSKHSKHPPALGSSTSSNLPSHSIRHLSISKPFKKNRLFSRFLGSYVSHRQIRRKGTKKKSVVNPTSPALMAPIDICPRRFINTHTLKLIEFGMDDFIPPYAILSHRWIEGEEVVYGEFQEMAQRHSRSTWEEVTSKPGYQKIQFACRQARQDGFHYIWVDTCCIVQGVYSEMNANITSMYAYYQNAQVCYAYLVDVHHEWTGLTEWFYRGWTLQELLAPRTVIFFNKYWKRIGDKHELQKDLSQKTNIPLAVLAGEQSVQDVDVLTRLTWIRQRTTAKEQDRAYCLQGLLGVSIKPIHETSFVSFNRLGRALLEAHPELKEKLATRDKLFCSHRWILKEREKEISIPNPISPVLMVPVDICPPRLIDTSSLELVEFNKTTVVPPYAILSHRWISDQEVVYTEFLKPDSGTFLKSGSWKIESACRQARRDGIRYIWIDTCCIKQGNHADVKTNITSMYAYYQNAEVCYVYLTDVSGKSFRDSQWFRRGWTLQELLAPRTVILFNKNWQYIGDKQELRDEISRQTTIPRAVLSTEQSIQDIDVLTRMSWTIWRKTTRSQDGAYCLQGLLGVSVEPNYEESWYSSFNRLGKALFDAQPELKKRLGINDDLFRDPNSPSFYDVIFRAFWRTLI